MYNDIIVYHSGHFEDNCFCSFCLNRKGIIEALQKLNFNVFVEKFECNWNYYYPAHIHFDYAIRYQNKIFGSIMFEANKLPDKVISFVENYFDYIICGSNFIKEMWKNSGIEDKYLISSSCGTNINLFKINTNISPLYPNKFKFLTVGAWQVGDWGDRKGFLLSIKLFKKLFSNDKSKMLIIKTNDNRAKEFETDQIKVIIDKYNDAQLAHLYQSCAKEGAYIHPHKGEGFGRTVLEAALCGCRIGATNYSGVLDFLNISNSTLFNYDLIPSNIYNEEFYKNREKPLFANPNEIDIERWMEQVSKNFAINYNIPDKLKYNWENIAKTLISDIYKRMYD